MLLALTAAIATAAGPVVVSLPVTQTSADVSQSGIEASPPEKILLANLRRHYPDVARWDIEPLTSSVQEPAGVHTEAGPGRVVHLGPRSAVRVGRHVLWFAVAGFQNVVIATRWLRAGAAVDASSGITSERDVIAAGCDPVTELASLRGARATRALSVNSVICRNSIEPRPTVARGDEVTVLYIGHFVSLSTRGVAQQDGSLGDVLNVRTTRHDGVFPAVVSGEGEVTVHE
ncbi:MAG TPA: flagellar basal body P-ring formation chaperone FlgA [Steroidobacteraceae bacterium]|jgi:flagella basal body P-ring formation protein FlgA